MRDIPQFSTDYGTAGLVLNQIPYTGNAYVHIRNTIDLQLLMDECIGFCLAAGAEHVFACGNCDMPSENPHVRILMMQRPIQGIGVTDACLMPVTEETIDKWLKIHNDAMTGVDHAAYLSQLDGRRLLKDGGGYFIHRQGELLGVGVASGSRITSLAATKRGEGRTVLLSLCNALSEEIINLEVAESNKRAIKLYENLGFLPVGVKCTWYKFK